LVITSQQHSRDDVGFATPGTEAYKAIFAMVYGSHGISERWKTNYFFHSLLFPVGLKNWLLTATGEEQKNHSQNE